MLTFEQFKSAVISDLAGAYKPHMADGFRNYEAEIGRGGYQFNVSTMFGWYTYEKGEWSYDGGRGSSGSGASLSEAQDAEDANYVF